MDDIIKLLVKYKEFTEVKNSHDLAAFGRWLSSSSTELPLASSGEPEVDSHGLNAMVSYLMGGLIGYAEAWLKLSFQDLPVVSLLDFGILKTVEYRGYPSKTDIVDNVIAERTTTIESIKRMVTVGLLREKEDKADKRLRRVMLTEKGKKVTDVLNFKMIAFGNLLVGDLSVEEKNQLAHLLNKLNSFHSALYKGKERTEIKSDFAL